MKEKLKKVLTTTIISAVSATAIGCSSTNTKLAKNIDKSMAEFVSSINNLDYVETSSPSSGKIGKIVETSVLSAENSYAQNNTYLNSIDNSNIENTITRPSERSDNFKLYVLSESPYVSFTSDNDSATFNMYVKFSTNKIEKTSDEIDSKINELILKRSILMIYVNEIYSGNVTITEENKVAIGAYVNVIKENASFLKGNRGMVKNQLNLASDLINKDANENLVNYYIIKSGEALETRSSKIDSTISAIDSIIDILEVNLTSSSPYYQKSISSTYENILENIKAENSNTQISANNKEIADNIAESLNIEIKSTSDDSTTNNSSQTREQLTKNTPQTQNDNSINVKNLNLNLPQNSQNQNLNIKNSTNEIEYRTNETHDRNNNSTIPNTTNENNNNISSTTTTQNNSQNNTTRNRIRRRPNRRVNKNNAGDMKRDSQSNIENSQSNSPTISSSSTNSNSAKSVVNMDNQNSTTIRAERTPEHHTREEYNSSKITRSGSNNQATRVPYRTNSTFRQ